MYSSTKELHIDSVEFGYSNRELILSGAVLSCKIGSVVGLLGRNGTGKSTLLKIMFGSLKAKHAYIRLNGKRITQPFSSREVCYLPQDPFLPTSFLVDKAVKLMCKDAIIQNVIFDDQIIQPVRYQKIADLSGGELRYLEFLLLIHQPAVFMLLDEPFSGVSPLLKEKIMEKIVAFSAKKGFIVSDHDYQHVLDVSNEIVLIQNKACRKIHHKRELEQFYVPIGTFDEKRI